MPNFASITQALLRAGSQAVATYVRQRAQTSAGDQTPEADQTSHPAPTPAQHPVPAPPKPTSGPDTHQPPAPAKGQSPTTPATTPADTASGASYKPPEATPATADSPGDYVGLPTLTYAPHPGHLADPGEVVWGWVPYEEDHTQGKDRPVLIVSRDGDWLLGLPLSSVDHDLDAGQEAREGRYWVELGTGDWDNQGRTSYVRVDRIIRLAPDRVRRIGGTVAEAIFDKVAAGLKRHWAD
jgi:mRNA-degrading endonuclease toxin of MazEF toxin-antitoxin module